MITTGGTQRVTTMPPTTSPTMPSGRWTISPKSWVNRSKNVPVVIITTTMPTFRRRTLLDRWICLATSPRSVKAERKEASQPERLVRYARSSRGDRRSSRSVTLSAARKMYGKVKDVRAVVTVTTG
jgi:hypothetical protein